MSKHVIIGALTAMVGGGKTIMAIKALETLIKKRDVKVVWLCSHQTIAAQVARTLEEIGDPLLAQSIAAIDVQRHRQTLIDRMVRSYDLIVLDELHKEQEDAFFRYFHDEPLAIFRVNSVVTFPEPIVDAKFIINDNDGVSTIISTESR